MLLKLCYQFISLRWLHCISSKLFTVRSGSFLGSLCPSQWSHPIHSLWQQQWHGNYLNTIYSHPGSPALDKEPNTCSVTKRNAGHLLFPPRKNGKTISNNVDNLELLSVKKSVHYFPIFEKIMIWEFYTVRWTSQSDSISEAVNTALLLGACPHYHQRNNVRARSKELSSISFSYLKLAHSSIVCVLVWQLKNKKRNIYLFTFYSTAITFG